MPELSKKVSKSGFKEYQGFTLLELAIVLVLIGILVGIGAGLMGILVKRVKVNETKETVKAARESLISYAGERGCFNSNASHYVRKSVDAWGKGLMFIFAKEIVEGSIGGVSGTCTDICNRKSTGLTVKFSGKDQKDIAFVVISGGLNYNIQTFNSTLNCTSPTNPEDPVLCICRDNCTIFIPEPGEEVDDPYSSSTDPDQDEPYDDIVEWVSLYELRQSRCGGRPPLRIITSSLPEAYQNQYYRAQIKVEGGVPSYNWKISGSLRGNFTFSCSNNNCSHDNFTCSFTCDNSTCTINGTINDCAGIYDVIVRVTDNETNTATRIYSLVVHPEPLVLSPRSGTTWYATNGTDFLANITVSGGKDPEIFCNSQSCGGLTCNYSGNTATISGNATLNGSSSKTCHFTISANDTCNQTITGIYTIVITP